MPDVTLTDITRHLTEGGSLTALVEAAASVANAIHIGAGGMIVGSLMEAELRKALGLKKGQLVNVRQGTRPGSVSITGE